MIMCLGRYLIDVSVYTLCLQHDEYSNTIDYHKTSVSPCTRSIVVTCQFVLQHI